MTEEKGIMGIFKKVVFGNDGLRRQHPIGVYIADFIAMLLSWQ